MCARTTDLPLVSIVIPCFNYGHFLSQTLASVNDQHYGRTEIIVVDDGSTDGTAQIAAAHDVLLVRQRNHGLSAARNAGLMRARGEFVIFLDADDELLPEAIQSGVAAMKADDRIACLVRLCQVVDINGDVLPAKYPTIHDGENLYQRWLRENFVWTPGAAMFRRDRIESLGGFPLDVGAAADYAVYLKCARGGAAAFQNVPVVRYRQHHANMSRDPVLMLKSTLAVYAQERPHVGAADLAAFDEGVTAARAHYGEQIVERLRRSQRQGGDHRWRVQAFATLVRHCPRVFLEHTGRKLSRAARGLPPAPVEPGRFERD